MEFGTPAWFKNACEKKMRSTALGIRQTVSERRQMLRIRVQVQVMSYPTQEKRLSKSYLLHPQLRRRARLIHLTQGGLGGRVPGKGAPRKGAPAKHGRGGLGGCQWQPGKGPGGPDGKGGIKGSIGS